MRFINAKIWLIIVVSVVSYQLHPFFGEMFYFYGIAVSFVLFAATLLNLIYSLQKTQFTSEELKGFWLKSKHLLFCFLGLTINNLIDEAFDPIGFGWNEKVFVGGIILYYGITKINPQIFDNVRIFKKFK